jgi:hypothetical protein
MRDNIFLANVKGAEPEKFTVIILSEDLSRVVHGSRGMSEEELRKALRKMPEHEFTSRIAYARKHPT